MIGGTIANDFPQFIDYLDPVKIDGASVEPASHEAQRGRNLDERGQ